MKRLSRQISRKRKEHTCLGMRSTPKCCPFHSRTPPMIPPCVGQCLHEQRDMSDWVSILVSTNAIHQHEMQEHRDICLQDMRHDLPFTLQVKSPTSSVDSPLVVVSFLPPRSRLCNVMISWSSKLDCHTLLSQRTQTNLSQRSLLNL